MKQTALQWFIEQLEFDESMSKEDIQPVIDKALEMEKEQIKQLLKVIKWYDEHGDVRPDSETFNNFTKLYSQMFKIND